MAKPRVFVSSTYYDLRHIRSSLDIFVEALGYESILSEKGDIAYNPDVALDTSCYREAESADIFVLIIGGRYGAEASAERGHTGKGFFERYESITKTEYKSAIRKEKPTYILIEGNVYAEYQTYLKNRENEQLKYAHVDSINIFRFIEEILAQPRNNPTHTFERFADIESWLRDQWAGLFRDMLNRRSQQKELSDLSLQVAELKETNTTMRTYLEAVMLKISPADSTKLIDAEKTRLAEAELKEKLHSNRFWKFLKDLGLENAQILDALTTSSSVEEFAGKIEKQSSGENSREFILGVLRDVDAAKRDAEELRTLLGLGKLKSQSETS